MAKKPTYEELEQRVKELEKEALKRGQAGKELRESEERYRLLAENTLDVIWKMDLNLEFTYVNSAILDTLGFTPEEWIGTRLPEHCSPEKIQKIESIIAHELENLEKHTGVVFEANFFNKNGGEIPGEVNGKILFDENGKPIGFQGSSRDITERKLAEEALRESEAQKKALLDASIDRIRFVDTDMKIIWANKTTTRELNIAPEDLIGQFCYEALIGKDTPCHGCPTTKALKTGNIEQTILHHPYSKGTKGETYWDTYAVPIKNESGDILNFIQVSRNITERKQAEEQLSRHTEQISKHKLALQKLAKMDFADFDVALKSTTELASQSLEAERVCVWLFNEDQSEMVCQDLYQLSHDSHEKGLTLKSKDYPNYFRALKEKGAVAADDAQNDPLTNELTEEYLKPLGITSRLSAAILLQSDFVGGVSAEHTGPLREWSEEEQTFLISIADLVTLALEIARRQQTEIELKKHKYRLEELVEERTAELKKEISGRKKTEEELQRNVDDLERFSKLAVGREEQMIKLKKEINELLRGLGQPDKYKIVD